MSDIQQYFSGKTVLLTGATGFLGKALVEKMLRALPGIHRLYLLIRPKQRGTRTMTAAERFRGDLLKASVFDRLKRELGDGFDSYVEQRVAVVAGDLADDRLGVSDDDYRILCDEVDVLINSAAVVVFDERLDVSLNMNTLGVHRMLAFARACKKLQATIHISTCYVSGQATGWVQEDLRPVSFDVDAEATRLKDKVAELKTHYAGQPNVLKDKLVKLGLDEARARGWNDTYTFTKSLGENLLAKHCGDMPTVLLRPSIIESSFAEPEPGWIDGFRMCDPLFVGYGKGYLQDFPGRPDAIADFIPCDHVVNSILASTPRCAREKGFRIYQVATGEHNPAGFRVLYDASKDYFNRNPMQDKAGNPIPTPNWTWPDPKDFRNKLVWRYRYPLSVAETLLKPFGFIKSLDKMRRRLKAKGAGLDLMLYYVDIYTPYTMIESRFSAANTRELWESLSAEDKKQFPFDATAIDWADYIANIHIPGLKKNVLNLTVEEAAEGSGTPMRTIRDLLGRSADRYPDAVALQMKRGGQWVKLTYDELERRVNAASAVLNRLNIHKGDRVLLYAENQPEWGIAYLAAVSLGVIVVPLERQLHEQDVLNLVRFTEAKAVLTSESMFKSFDNVNKDGLLFLNINAGCRVFAPPTPSPSPTRGEGSLAPSPLVGEGQGGGEDNTPPSVLVESDDVASIIFTSGVHTPTPLGVMLTHRNFLANVMGGVQLLPPRPHDNFLSILPLHHALEFTAGFLVPLYAGATVTYCESMRSQVILDTLAESKATALIGAPRIFQVMYDNLKRQVSQRGRWTKFGFNLMLLLSKTVRALTGREIGRQLFAPVHQRLGGSLRGMISGGAKLAPRLFDDFTAMGFELCEGYGLTETSPVVTVNPLRAAKRGSVGLPLPGVEVRIHRPDERGVGEVAVRGANVTRGYYRNPQATADAIQDGWLFTGDVGYLDKEGYLHLTGRSKDVIVTPAGKNVYPEEVEALYAAIPGVRELCVVGLWDDDVVGETVHAVVVVEKQDGKVTVTEEALRQVLVQRGMTVPRYQRMQRLHIFDEDLPRTLAGAIDRTRVRQQLVARLRATGHEGVALPRQRKGEAVVQPLHDELGGRGPLPGEAVEDGVLATLSRLSGVERSRIAPETNLDTDLHLDPLDKAELLLELETHFQEPLPDSLAGSLRTVGDLVTLVRQRVGEPGGVALMEVPGAKTWGKVLRSKGDKEDEVWLKQTFVRTMARAMTRRAMKFYAWAGFGFEAYGVEHLPPGPFIVASNHSSHLDTGAIVTACGPRGHELFVMGARDYFFGSRLKGWFFNAFLKVIPFDRNEHIIEGLRLAQAVLRAGHPVLIYPEGRRSVSGQMGSFKAGIGLLGVELGVPIVPCCVEGTFAALPKGRAIPKHGKVRVTFAPPVDMEQYRSIGEGMDRRDLWRRIAEDVNGVVNRMLQQGKPG